ncbi:MAG: hypothetical protein WBD31_22745, partial [Rubripirellula sp.]
MTKRRVSQTTNQKRRSLFERLESRQLLCSIAPPGWHSNQQRFEGNALVAYSEKLSVWHDVEDQALPVLYNDYDNYSGSYYGYGYGPSQHTDLHILSAVASLGTATVVNGELLYTAPPKYAGFDRVDYTISNGVETLSSFALIEVVNDPVIARNDPGFYHENNKGGRWSSGSNYHASWGDYGVFTNDPTFTSDYNYTFTGWYGGATSWSRAENQIVLNRNATGGQFVFDVTENDIDLDLLTATAIPSIGAVPIARTPILFDPLRPGRLSFSHNNAPPGDYEILYEATDGISASTAIVKVRVVDGPVGGAYGWTESTGTGGSSGYDMTADEGRLFDENFYFQSEVAVEYERGYTYNSPDLVFSNTADTITDPFGNVFHRDHGTDQYFLQGPYVTESGANSNVGAVMSIGYGNPINGETHVVYTYDLAAFDPVTLTIDWGDGQTSQSVVEFQMTSVYLPSRRISISCSGFGGSNVDSPAKLRILGKTNLKHVYEAAGNFTITANHPTYSIQKTISVEESRLYLDLDSSPSLIAGISNDVGEFRDTNLIDEPTNYIASATWTLPNFTTATSDVTLTRTTPPISNLLLYQTQNQPKWSRYHVDLQTPAGV